MYIYVYMYYYFLMNVIDIINIGMLYMLINFNGMGWDGMGG